MSVKIRLTRQGKKKFAYYHIVIADSRAPRAGRFTEKIGTYNPNTDPATIDISFDKAMEWLDKGAQPTETVRAILSYKGILMKRHLLGGVKKGALTEEEANRRFEEWMKQKESKIDAKRERISKEKEEYVREHMEQESKVKEVRAQEILKKTSKLAEQEEAGAEGEQKETGTPAPETQAPETPAPETPVPETPAPETPAPETPAPEVTPEAADDKKAGKEETGDEKNVQEQMTEAEKPLPKPAEGEKTEQ
jgi:small subunit ribosomal protein S16